MKSTPHNTAVCGINAWPDGAPEGVKLHLLSAAEMGIPLKTFSFGEFNPNSRGSFFTMVTRFAAALEHLEPVYEYVLYADTRDVLFVRPLDEICAQFNEFNSPFVMGAEPGCWPDNRPEFSSRFPKISPYGFDYPNCGVWMGERARLKKMFNLLENVRAEILDGKHGTDVKWHDVAQYNWQVLALTAPIAFSLDREAQMISNYSWTPEGLKSFDEHGAKVGDSRPSILHFPGGHEEMLKETYRKVFLRL